MQAPQPARLRAARPCGRLNEHSLTTLLLGQGGAHLLDSVPSWGASCPDWQECVASLSARCVCPPPKAPRITCCWSCGGASLPTHAGVAGATRMATLPAIPATTPSTTADSAVGTAERARPMRQMQAPSAPIAGCTGLAALRLALGAEQCLWMKACSCTFGKQPSSARLVRDRVPGLHHRCA